MKRSHRELYTLIAAVENEREAQLLLSDLFTHQEIESLAERWQLIRQLSNGTSQREIASNLGVSISKITRGSTMLKHGSGGFRHFLRKLEKSNDAKNARTK